MRPASRAEMLRYHGLAIKNSPPEYGLVLDIEQPTYGDIRTADFVLDLSRDGQHFDLPKTVEIHGSYLVVRSDVLLFGPCNLVSTEGLLFNESRRFQDQWLNYINMPFYNGLFPGMRPKIHRTPEATTVDTLELADKEAVKYLDEPVFLATPQEPPTWGRWICTVIPKARHYLKYGGHRKFFCFVRDKWQRDVLNFLGVSDDHILPHDPGATYICRDVMTVEQTDADLKISPEEKNIFYELTIKSGFRPKLPRNIYVARLSRSINSPNYRVLQNEEDLARRLVAKDFMVVEPEFLPFPVQIAIFSRAQNAVFLGGSGIFNAAFSPPDAHLITIESSSTYVRSHAGFFGSLQLAHGVIFGQQDPVDLSEHHRRWTLELEPALDAILRYCK